MVAIGPAPSFWCTGGLCCPAGGRKYPCVGKRVSRLLRARQVQNASMAIRIRVVAAPTVSPAIVLAETVFLGHKSFPTSDVEEKDIHTSLREQVTALGRMGSSGSRRKLGWWRCWTIISTARFCSQEGCAGICIQF